MIFFSNLKKDDLSRSTLKVTKNSGTVVDKRHKYTGRLVN